MTPETLNAATGCGILRATTWAPHIMTAAIRYGIDSRERLACWVAQMTHESGYFATLEESLNYSVSGLMRVFERHRISAEDAARYGRNDATKQRANQEALANTLYGGPWGAVNLGNTQPGDGWLFRGRGLKQITGRANYSRYEKASGFPVVAYPDLVRDDQRIAADSAGWFWQDKKLNALADRLDVAAITRLINGGDNGLDARKALTQRAYKAL